MRREPVRVLQVGKFYFPVPGGMETVLQHLCEELRHHVELHVLVANTHPTTVTEWVNGVLVTRAARWGHIASLPLCPSLLRLLAERRADILHIHEPNPMATMATLAVNPQARVIVSFHSEVIRQRLLRRFYRPFLERLLHRADRIIVATPRHLDSPSLLPYREKCVVIPFGIDVARFHPTEALRAHAEALRARWGSPLILFVGRLVYYKGIEYAIAAMMRTPARLLIIGRGPRERTLKHRVRALGLEERVIFLGEVAHDQLPAYYHACEFLILPSTCESETFGIVQLEAMASGKPVISTRLPTGVSWVNRHGMTGLLVPPADVEALADAMNRLLEDEALRRRMGEAARHYAHTQFTRQRMAHLTLSLYEDVLFGAKQTVHSLSAEGSSDE